MRRKLSLVLIVSVFAILKCGKDETEDTSTEFTEFNVVSEISFGSGWQSSDSTIIHIDTIFFPNDTICYEVKFGSPLLVWFMVKKEWRWNNTLLFSAVAPIPKGTKRICGEFRRYDGQALAPGIYEISVLYFNPDSARYVSVQYNPGINRKFRIQ